MVKKGQGGGIDDAFRSGSLVHFYQANEAGLPKDQKNVRRGIVRKVRAGNAEVILDGEPLDSVQMYERWTIDERADDRTYRLMAEALSYWINTEDRVKLVLRNGLMGFGTRPKRIKVKEISHPSLNTVSYTHLTLPTI